MARPIIGPVCVLWLFLIGGRLARLDIRERPVGLGGMVRDECFEGDFCSSRVNSVSWSDYKAWQVLFSTLLLSF